MRIVVDAMGSDEHPAPEVAGSILASKKYDVTVILTGKRDVIEAEMAKHSTAGASLEVVEAEEVITMTDKPAEASKQKQQSSMHVGMRLVKEGEADAFVSAGNTGAALAVATLHTLRRIRGIKRPALAAVFQNITGLVTLCDFGANVNCRPEHLTQFASMASIYATLAMKVDNPRVALLSNGEEEGKGDELVRETTPLMREMMDINYIGNVEPKEVLFGETDIAVADGFVGNIMGKSLEAMGSYMGKLIRMEATADPLSALGGLLVKPALERVRKRIDPEEIGGIPLLGLNGVVIIGHGRSNEIAIKNAIRQARDAVEYQVVDAIRESL